jgi:hypothetical protein
VKPKSHLRYSLVDDSDAFNLYLRIIFKKAFHLNQNHGWIVLTQSSTIPLTNFLSVPFVFGLVYNVNGEAGNLLWYTAGFGDDGDYICQGTIKLLNKIRAYYLLLFIPTDLTSDKK